MPASETDPRWSVALSGGGHRAALYGAGALLCLVDQGVNADVCSIVSVSGGSLTNGVLVQNKHAFSELNRAQYLKVVGALVNRCAYKGTVERSRELFLWAASVVALALAILGVCWDRTWRQVSDVLPNSVGTHDWPRVVALVIVIMLLLWVISIRSWVADRAFRRLLFTRDGKAVILRSPATGAADECPNLGVLHVFCASELQSRLHTYFSPRFVYNHDFGVSKEFELPLSTAVQVSSNFPPAFPARRLSVADLGLNRHEHASKLWLSDGGVYDNMAEEWVVRAYGSNPGTQLPGLVGLVEPLPNRMLVVNASKRDSFKKSPWYLSLPLVGELGVVGQITSLMHQVTTTNRRSRLVDEFDARRTLNAVKLDDEARRTKLERLIGIRGALTHIGTPADFIARWEDPPDGGRLLDVYNTFAALPADDQEWVAHSHTRVLSIGTRLKGTGEDAAAALLWQAYTLTLVNLYLSGYVQKFKPPTRAEMVAVLHGARRQES